MKGNITGFTIRIYGLLIEDDNILLSRETIGTVSFTKFPGGGLEFGEGMKECLSREFKEEIETDIEVGNHFYTTDFFQQSGFKPTDQLISVYFLVKLIGEIPQQKFLEFSLDNDGHIERMQLMWKPITELTENDVTFPIDKHVIKMLCSSHKKLST